MLERLLDTGGVEMGEDIQLPHRMAFYGVGGALHSHPRARVIDA